ncbi:MAG: M23 family metallopeptidase [Hungatella sp.]|nr:M23 family metallopeptidase [Hungatella sp.]
MKEKFNQMFKDKLFLVMLVLGLLTIVAAAGVVTIQRGNTPGEENPYMEQQQGAIIAEESPEDTLTQIAGNADAQREQPESHINNRAESEPVQVAKEAESTQNKGDAAGKGNQPEAAYAGSGMENAVSLVLDFSDTSKMAWPVMGNVLLDYSMDTTIYFPTLEQYQVNPGVVIQAEVSQPVVAPANAKVVAVSADEELGNFVVLDLGNDYVATCGQLKEIQVVENEYLEAGQVMGYVAEPTKYYSVEGSNVYFQLEHQGNKVDPIDYFE